MDARGTRKMRIGTVVSDNMDKTVVVAVERIVAHPLYGKRMKRTGRFMAHNEDNQAKVGIGFDSWKRDRLASVRDGVW